MARYVLIQHTPALIFAAMRWARARFWVHLVSAALVPVLLGAAVFGHGGFGFNWSNPNGGWEYPVMWAVVQAAVALLGDGAYALAPSKRTA